MFQKKAFTLVFLISICYGNLAAQESALKSFWKLSRPEKCWVVSHPFVAKKALKISIATPEETLKIKQHHILIGDGNGDQLDAFRHTYWMALLVKEIGERKSNKLGAAHEKGNYQEFKKGKLEDDVLPDKISSEMDLFNNQVGIIIGKNTADSNLVETVIEAIKNGNCKIIKTDGKGNFLDKENNMIPTTQLIGTWENNKVLVNSNYKYY